ncbi:hypothetical protein EWM64_g5979 [Hericium alpestre]|uniref:Uncharacterized protein n=1 Tax=Hericium alpestre TaxID=135208 RepID=A0A4Y9ZUX0_9AGAM|nr:hypothetical protein EWM64_g5979 [Hericium alpestre]
MDSPNTTSTNHGRKRSIFSRRASKRASTMLVHSSAHDSFGDKVKGADSDSVLTYESRDTFNQPLSRSIIPDPLNELPAWFNKESEWASAPVHVFRSRYPIHNPVGPHYYRNQHLTPPSSKKRPSSVFSPSFPPMSAEGEQTDEPGWMPDPSRMPSGSPLPTPSSSQVRLDASPNAAPKTRTRKLSNTPHDAVDLLDGSDPWGANWHHQSPYDLNVNPTSGDGSEQRSGRPRMASLNGGKRHKTTTPSPLSQSTSAVHLQGQEPEVEIAQVDRRLAKRKTGVRSVFDGKSDGAQDAPTEAQSAPVTPLDPSPTTVSSGSSQQKALGKKPSKIGSIIPPSASQISISVSSIAPLKKIEKRGSMLGRLAKRFSVMRKGGHRNSMATTDEGPDPGSRHGSVEPEGRLSTSAPRFPPPEKTPGHSRQSTEATKRVPPPALESDLMPTAEVTPTHPDADAEDKRSSVSLEAPFSVGRLTIANPDTPSSSENTPVRPFAPLPGDASSPVARATSRLRDDKALPRVAPAVMSLTNGFSSSPVDIRSPATFTNEAPSPGVSKIFVEALSGSATLAATLAAGFGQWPNIRQTSSSPQPSQNLPPTSPPTVPFPTPPVAVPSFVQAVAHSDSTDDSPLSKASLLVNPPTPHAPSANISPAATAVPSPVITPTPSGITVNGTGTHASRDSSPTKRESSTRIKSSSSVKSRETETFRLVRSPSTGYVHPTGDTIVVHGEQWQVVTEPPKRSKTAKEDSRQKKLSRKESKRQEKEREAAAKNHAHATNMDSVMGRPLSKGKEGSKKRKEHQANGHSTSVDSAAGKASANGGAQLERHPSTSTRPTSEITDLNAMRAKEVWEMDRLWKGRSIPYGLEGPQVVYTHTIGSSPSIPGDPYLIQAADAVSRTP